MILDTILIFIKKTRRKEGSKPEAGDQNNELEQTSTMVYTEVYCFTKHWAWADSLYFMQLQGKRIAYAYLLSGLDSAAAQLR